MATDARALLEATETIAVVGLSRDPAKAAHAIPAAAQACGFRILPVHPIADELLGERVHRTVTDITGRIDLVNVFRPEAEAPGIARAAVAVGAGGLWLQLGIRSDEARAIADAAGLGYVQDRCLGVEIQRYGIRRC